MNGMDRHTGRPLVGADHLRQSIDDILSTPFGTRVGRRTYGSLLPELLAQPLNDLGRLRVVAAAALALLRQEERARIRRVQFRRGDRPGEARLLIEGRRSDVSPSRPFAFDFTLAALGLPAA